MNRERIQAAIELMKTAQNLNMTDWQGPTHPFLRLRLGNVAESVEELHACGNTACFAGYLALSPEWREAGGLAGTGTGRPFFDQYAEAGAVAAYFGCDSRDEGQFVTYMVYGDLDFQDGLGTPLWSNFYNKLWEEVTPQDVIEKLEQLLEMDQ